MKADYDILVVGGGINGTAVARDAAGRGARVLLVEQDDLAAHTSSASTKLIHGGLRYLEQFEFRMVAKSLAERERLMRAAPHLIRPLQFVLPNDRGMRPRWMMWIGLLLYDHIGGHSSLPRSRVVNFGNGIFAQPLQPRHRRGYTYSDCWGDDSRLVIANAKDAAAHGATIRPRTKSIAAQRGDASWSVELEDQHGQREVATARILVNATGSWAARFLPEQLGVESPARLRLIKGSHIVTRRLFDGDHAYILQNPDKRIVFAIPYEENFTLIGTTDVDWSGRLDAVTIDEAEVDYLCQSVNRWFKTPIAAEDVVWSYAGLRPLYDDAAAKASEISRDYVLSLDDESGLAPVLSIFGGKITTHRVLAEEVMDKLGKHFPEFGAAWTGNAVLPGGELGDRGLAGLVEELKRRKPYLDERTTVRMARSYGSKVWQVLGDAGSVEELGRSFGGGLTEAEVAYLIAQEWAQTPGDILWRRSKLGLHLQPDEIERFGTWFDKRYPKGS